MLSPAAAPAQGIYLNEHRNYGGPRRLIITVQVRAVGVCSRAYSWRYAWGPAAAMAARAPKRQL